MKKVLLILFLVIFKNVSFSQSQLELNEQAYKNYKKTDKELNSIYQKILSEYKNDLVFIKNLKIAQKTWIQFRDAEMKMKFPERDKGYYGSVEPLCFSNHLEHLTKERIKTLKTWIHGVEEGEVCSGSIKIKE